MNELNTPKVGERKGIKQYKFVFFYVLYIQTSKLKYNFED